MAHFAFIYTEPSDVTPKVYLNEAANYGSACIEFHEFMENGRDEVDYEVINVLRSHEPIVIEV